MNKLIITFTCAGAMAYPSNPHNPTPKGYEQVAREYVRWVNAGASICHLHCPYTIDKKIQAVGSRLSDLDMPGGAKLRHDILDGCRTKPIIQYGIANGRFPQRRQFMIEQKPDMISTRFNTHDECFDYESRGLLDETLVLVISEHGRTPVISKSPGGGREHWAGAYWGMFFGAGIKTDQVIGATDRLSGYPVSRPTHPNDVLATVYHLLGCDPHATTVPDRMERPMRLTEGDIVQELLT